MKKPIVLVIMDGVGKGDGGSGDAVAVAKTPTLDHLLAKTMGFFIKENPPISICAYYHILFVLLFYIIFKKITTRKFFEKADGGKLYKSFAFCGEILLEKDAAI